MALRWMVTEHLTGRCIRTVNIDDPSLTADFTQSRATATFRTLDMTLPGTGAPDLARAQQIAQYSEPAGAYGLACIDTEPTAGWRGAFDRVIGEWQIRRTVPQTGASGRPVVLGGLLQSPGDQLLQADYAAEGYASWILSDLLTQCLAGVQVSIPKPAVGPILPVDWRSGKVTYGQAIQDVISASGVEILVRHALELTNGTPSRITRSINFGAPVRVLNDQRDIHVGTGGNGITVSRPTDITLWANSVNVYGGGSGDAQWAGNAARGKPPGMPMVTRSFSHPDVQSKALADAMAARHLAEMTGVEPLQVTCLRKNWTNKFPVLGDVHRVRVDKCVAFPDGIDDLYRITRIQYQPRDAVPETLQLLMEVSP